MNKDDIMFHNLLKRANLSNIEEFIMNGGELIKCPENKTYAESIQQIDNTFNQLIETYFKKEEHNKITDIIYEQIGILESVYFEIGLFAGMKIAGQIYEKTKEIM